MKSKNFIVGGIFAFLTICLASSKTYAIPWWPLNMEHKCTMVFYNDTNNDQQFDPEVDTLTGGGDWFWVTAPTGDQFQAWHDWGGGWSYGGGG